MESNCTICDIVSRKEKSFIVYEDENFISFLDYRPLFIGHCILSPKNHYKTLYDLPDNDGNDLLCLTKKLGLAIKQALKSEGTFIAINNEVSQSIPHMHMHIVPRTKGDGLKGFFWPRTKYENEEQMMETQIKIQKCLN